MKYSLKPFLRTIIEIIVPSGAQAILYFVLAWLSVFIIFFGYFFRILTGDPRSISYLDDTLSQYVTKADTIPFGDYLSSAFVWAVVGAVIYGALVVIINLFIAIDNKLKLIKGGLSQKLDFFSGISEYRRLTWIFITGVYLSLTVFLFLPSCIGAFKEALLASEPLKMLLIVFLLSVIYYFCAMLIRVVFRNPVLIARK